MRTPAGAKYGAALVGHRRDTSSKLSSASVRAKVDVSRGCHAVFRAARGPRAGGIRGRRRGGIHFLDRLDIWGVIPLPGPRGRYLRRDHDARTSPAVRSRARPRSSSSWQYRSPCMVALDV